MDCQITCQGPVVNEKCGPIAEDLSTQLIARSAQTMQEAYGKAEKTDPDDFPEICVKIAAQSDAVIVCANVLFTLTIILLLSSI